MKITRWLLVACALLVTVTAQGPLPERVLVMPVNSVNKPVNEWRLDDISGMLSPGSQLSQFVTTMTSGTIPGFTSTMRPMVTYPGSIDYDTWCGSYNWSTQWTLLQAAALNAAIAEGVDVASYPTRLYLYPSFNCNIAGQGVQAGVPLSGIHMYDHSFPTYLFAHEWGHTKGLSHPQSRVCDSSGARLGDSYDPYDVMRAKEFQFEITGLFQRLWLRWLDPARVVSVTGSGTWDLVDANASTGQMGLRILVPTTSTFSADRIGVEVRKDGVVIRNAQQFIYAGVPAHTYDSGRFVSEDTSCADGYQAVLAQGQSFVRAGITVTTEFYMPGMARVHVEFPGSNNSCTTGCAPGKPGQPTPLK